jgi:Uma2 family endonuclease
MEVYMATGLSEPPVAQADERFVLHGVGWEVYESIRQALGDHPTRLTFDGRNLELMSPSPLHESYSYLMCRLLDTLTLELRIQIRGGRSTTFRRPDLKRGLEPDNCYWIQSEPAVRGKPVIDLATDPPPDLAIEIDITHSSIDRRTARSLWLMTCGLAESWGGMEFYRWLWCSYRSSAIWHFQIIFGSGSNLRRENPDQIPGCR